MSRPFLLKKKIINKQIKNAQTHSSVETMHAALFRLRSFLVQKKKTKNVNNLKLKKKERRIKRREKKGRWHADLSSLERFGL